MGDLRNYVLCIGCAALLIGILTDFADPKKGAGALLRISCGLFLALQLMNPLVNLNPDTWLAYFDDLMVDGEHLSYEGEKLATGYYEEIIKDRTRTYILDKAADYRAELDAEVELDDASVPTAVTVTGSVSPYGKNQLMRIIESDLNIPKERQLWIGN